MYPARKRLENTNADEDDIGRLEPSRYYGGPEGSHMQIKNVAAN